MEKQKETNAQRLFNVWREKTNYTGTVFEMQLPPEQQEFFGAPASLFIRRLTIEEWVIVDALTDKNSFASSQKVCEFGVVQDPDGLLKELPGFVPFVAAQIIKVSGFAPGEDPLVIRLPQVFAIR